MVENFYKSRILPGRVSFKNEGQSEDFFFQDTQKWKEFITKTPGLQEMAKGSLFRY